MQENELSQKSVGKLIVKFSLPCVISMLVAALYNIVDQIFIGWSEAGAFGNAATNIVYPFTVISLAFALLFGDGAAAGFSLSLGAGEKKKANRFVGNGLFLLICISILITAFAFAFSNKILLTFGASEDEPLCFEYAKQYFRVIAMGLPFYIIGQGMNAEIRNDGSPGYAMAATMAGALANIVLDPVFIFALKMGVEGAAIATVAGQVLSFALSVIYLKKSKNFKLSFESMKLDSKVVSKILSLGSASLITQLAIVIIITVANNLVVRFGPNTIASTGEPFGIVTPLAVIGICMKVFGIAVSIVIGISLGGMPIIGFNMGAGNFKRVKQTVRCILLANAAVGLAAFLIFQLFPDLIINAFGSHNTAEYMEYARLCLKIFLGGIILTCLTKSTSILLQSMGSGFKSTAVALCRDVVYFVPAIIILAFVSKSVSTMLWSAVIADVLAFVTAALLLLLEIRSMEKKKAKV